MEAALQETHAHTNARTVVCVCPRYSSWDLLVMVRRGVRFGAWEDTAIWAHHILELLGCALAMVYQQGVFFPAARATYIYISRTDR